MVWSDINIKGEVMSMEINLDNVGGGIWIEECVVIISHFFLFT